MDYELKHQFLIQIISIDGKVRSDRLTSKLHNQNLDFTILEGVVPTQKQYSKSELHNKFISNLICQRQLTLGEIGCASSHRLAASNLLNSNHKFGLTFEDDAEIILEFDLDNLKNILDAPNPVIVNLGWIPGYAIASKENAEFVNDLLEVFTPPTCAFGYAYNKAAAQLIANDFNKIIDVADWPINLLGRAKFYIVNPAWVQASQNPGDSTIGQRIKLPKNKFVANLLNRFRLIFSLISLLIWSLFKSKKISFGQVVHRLILRDMLFKIGRAEISRKHSIFVKNNIVFKNPQIDKMAKLLKKV